MDNSLLCCSDGGPCTVLGNVNMLRDLHNVISCLAFLQLWKKLEEKLKAEGR
jgi:hypothetical protein